jgi:hypothetical protein
MTAKWPRTDTLKRGAMKRGGDRKDREIVKVQITVKTEMPCGAELQETDRVFKTEERTVESDLKDNLGIKARQHLSSCKQCNK